MHAIHPQIIICRGATAAQAVIGKTHHLLQERGKFFPHPFAKSVTATVYPSPVLRAVDSGQRRAAYLALVDDLRAVRREVARMESSAG